MSIHLEKFSRLQQVVQFERLFEREIGMRNWNFKDRRIVESLTSSEFSQLLAAVMPSEPVVISEVDLESNHLLLGVLFKSPPGRISYSKWQPSSRLVPSFATFCAMTDADRQTTDYLRLSEDQVGSIGENRTLAMPADGSRVDVRLVAAGHRVVSRSTVTKRDAVITIKEPLPIDDALLRDIIKKEVLAAIDDGNRETSVPPEPSEGEAATTAHAVREAERQARLDAEQVLVDEKVSQAKRHYETASELIIDLAGAYRLVFESGLTNVDQ